MAIIPEVYLNAATSVGIHTENTIKWIGSGFFAVRTVDANGGASPFFITNKHVLEGNDTIVLRLNRKENRGVSEIDAHLKSGVDNLYFVHPDNDVDIAVLPLRGDFITKEELDYSAFDIDNNAMDSASLRDAGVDEGALVHMLGFPMGLVNSSSTLPICRLGCVARLSDAQIAETKNILVDIQNFPGNSGSPIVTRPEIISISGTKSLSRSMLLGIVHSYIPYHETLRNTQTNEIVEVRSENSGIAMVHPVELIREVVDLFVQRYQG